jgi:DNA-binding response OmpR family regulator/signal transduction histidine kinase
MKTAARNGQIEILIVEDSPTQAEELKYILERHGYRLSLARNGRDALAAIARRLPTLVISDVVMPEMGGYELCRHIKQDPRSKGIPVVLLTSLSDPADVISGLESGADSFIFKPYDEQYLLARIAYIMANRHLRENDRSQMGVEIVFGGKKFFITSDRLQILNLLLSTYEAAVHKNQELSSAQEELKHLNENLETKVRERTSALVAEIAERKQAEQKQQSQLGRLNLLHKITRAIGERQDLQSICQVVVRTLEDNLPIAFGCVCLFDKAANALVVSSVGAKSAALAMDVALAEQTRIEIDANGFARCMRGELVYEPDIAQVPFPFTQRLAQGGLGSCIIAPLQVESQVFGALLTARREKHAFNSGECEFLLHVSEHVALAAHQVELYDSLRRAYADLQDSQQAAMQHERLQALGEMASGIAHDINNAISPITLYTESLLEQEPNLSEQARSQLATIQHAAEGVAQTVARMREFYRPRPPQLEFALVDLNEQVRQAIQLTRVRWSDVPQARGIVIQLQSEFADDLPSVTGADNEIHDAVTNLIFNAVDAMPSGGTLTLRTRLVSAQHEDQDHEGTGLVHLEVCDTGIGMDEDTRRRCLEPFFTTKGERGTGLGLAMVYGMAQRHSAELDIVSKPGAGTMVRLIFPAAASARVVTSRSSAASLPTRSMRILLVDDDRLIIESLRHALESDGHVVTVADGGQAGIDAFAGAQARGESFAVVITDLGMPYVDGRKVAAAVKAVSSSTPVILLTGWGQRLMDDKETPSHVDRVLSKPAKLRELRSALANLGSGAP